VPHPRFIARPAALVFATAVLIFGLALCYRLGVPDIENDEAIYTYSVEKMLDSGDWLTPRTIPGETPFLEKPPLKFWMVAAPIRVGVLPRSPFGLRFVDALLGALAFGYVALFGYRLGGLACAVASPLVLFGIRDLVLLHGLRSNNMEAALVAAYAGGLYHFVRWREDGRRRDALIVGAWFTLAFMTKFVAAAFMPLVALGAFALPQEGHAPKPFRAAVADWGWTAAIAAAVSAPWFVYQYLREGWALIDTMFLMHVFARFTGHLDPQHLHPGSYYLVNIVGSLRDARTEWLVAAGAGLLLYRIVKRRDATAWLVLLWAAVPLSIMSGLSSKLYHYAYPFLPPFALAGGLALAAPLGVLRGPLERLAARLEASRLWGVNGVARRPAVRYAALTVAVLAVVVAGIALMFGSTRVWVFGVPLRNSSVVRPLAIAVAAVAIARAWRHALTVAPVALLALLPLAGARETLIYASRQGHALRTLGDCARPLAASGRIAGGAYGVSAIGTPHSYYYYFLSTGEFVEPVTEWALLEQAIRQPGAQRPIVLSHDAYMNLAFALTRDSRPMPPAIRTPPGWVVLLPGPLGACADAAVLAGGRSVGGSYGGP
jgi:4-amino-4-deoxy-L-arabinose transferase-like glycosyltransferase